METARYRFVSPSAPAVSGLMLVVAAGFAWLVLTQEEIPLLGEILLWGFVALALMVLLGTMLRTSVVVDAEGHFSMTRRVAGVPVGDVQLRCGEIRGVELNRTMTPGLERANDTVSSSPDKPRYRLEVVHGKGKHLVLATASKSIEGEAIRLARALDCPLQKTGDWFS